LVLVVVRFHCGPLIPFKHMARLLSGVLGPRERLARKVKGERPTYYRAV